MILLMGSHGSTLDGRGCGVQQVGARALVRPSVNKTSASRTTTHGIAPPAVPSPERASLPRRSQRRAYFLAR